MTIERPQDRRKGSRRLAVGKFWNRAELEGVYHTIAKERTGLADRRTTAPVAEPVSELKACPFCGHHANEAHEERGQQWGTYQHVIQCSSSHCGAQVRIVADGWEENLNAELNPHIPADRLHDDRLLQLRRMWNRRYSKDSQ